MAHDGKVIIDILGDASDFTKTLQGLASKGVKALTAGVTAATAALTAAAGAAAKLGMEYETATAKLQTIAGAEHIGALSADILSLSNATGEAAADLADVAYNAISAGVAVEDAVGMAETATKLATAGFTDTSSALSVLTTALNSYGDEAGTAAEISDSLIQVQNLGVTTVAELSANMGKAIATGSAYGVSLGNLESAYVSVTKAGINTAEGTTYLNSMMNELGDTGSDIAKIIKKQTGKSFSDLMGEGKSLADVLGIVYEALGEDSTAMMNLWGSAEAGKAANAIINQGLETFNENLEAITDSAGATESAYETMARTLSFQTDRLKTRIKNLGITIYDYFSESLVDGVSSVSDAFEELGQRITTGDLADEMQDIGDAVSDLITTGAELAADVLPAVIDGLSRLTQHARDLVGVLEIAAAAYLAYEGATIAAKIATEGLNIALGLSPWGLLAAGAAAGVAAMVVLHDRASELTDEQKDLVDSIERTSEANEVLAQKIIETGNAYTTAKTEIEGQKATNDALISSLVAMASGYDGTAASMQQMQNWIDQLNSAIPGLNLAWNEQENALNMTEDAMRALNEQYSAQEAYDAALSQRAKTAEEVHNATVALTNAQTELAAVQEEVNNFTAVYGTMGELVAAKDAVRVEQLGALVDAENNAEKAEKDARAALTNAKIAAIEASRDVVNYGETLNAATENAERFTKAEEESTDAIEDQADATKEATKQTAKIALKAQDAVKSGENLADTYDELSAELETLAGSGDPYIESLAEQALKMLDVAVKSQDLRENYSDLVDATGFSASAIAASLSTLGMSADEFASGCESMKERVINSFNEISVNEELTGAKMAENLQNNLQIHNDWSSNLVSLWNSTQDQTVRAFILYLYDQGPEYAAAVNDFANGGTEELAAAAAAWSEIGDSTAAGYAAAVSGQSTLAEAAAGNLASAAVTGAENADMSTAGETSGDEYATSLSDTADSAASAAETVAESAIEAFDSYANQFSASGKNAATQIANAFTTGSAGFSARARTRANDIKNAFTSVSWSSVGFNIASGIATGLSNGSYLITQAATSAAQAALNAAKRTLGISSPSKKFRKEVGRWIPPGIGEGVEDAMPELETDVRSELSGLTKKATAAVRSDQSRVNSTAVRYTGSSVSNATARRLPDQHIEFTVKGRTLAKAIAHDVGGYMEWEVLS